jgi:competence transcription factor ComK
MTTQANPFVTVTMIRTTTANYNEATGEVSSVENTTQTPVNATWIRAFYPRKNDRPGTRITFVDGSGFAIQEAYGAFREKVWNKARFVDLDMKVSETEQSYEDSGYDSFDDETGEVSNLPATIDRVEQFSPACVNAMFVRSFNERKNNAPGTRLTFSNKKGMVVKQTVTEAYELLIGTPVAAIAAPVPGASYEG